MKKNFTLFLICCFFFVCTIAQNVQVITGNLIRTTPALRDFKPSQSLVANIAVRDEDGIIGEDEDFEEGVNLPKGLKLDFKQDPALQLHYPNLPYTTGSSHRGITNTFDGIPYSSTAPADPTVAVGPNHIIQMVNGTSGALFQIFSNTGTQLIVPTYLDNITGKGGLGDPMVLYDHLADRFIMTEFVNKNETIDQGLSIAVSQTNDPTGSWYIYFFSTGTTFPDYPKFSVWNNAYYAKTNDFNSANAYMGSSVYAFDRNKMLAGNTTATVQKITIGATYKEFSMTPVSLQGNSLPPSGSGGLFTYMNNGAWTGSSTDSIGILEFNVDFITPSNSKIVTKVSLAAAGYKSDICGASRSQCIPQPGTTVMLEALDQRIMNQPMYRNFGGYEGIVFTHLADRGSNIAGIRWYELKKTNANWSIYQQSTYSPDTIHRFMSSISYDAKGNIGLVYNVSGNSVFPGIRYTGRKQCDALNTMTFAENSIADGTAANKNSRYGDYNHLVCDPDGKTFWFTGMYNSSANWSSRISSFTLDTCVVLCGDPTGLIATKLASTTATINWNGVGGALSYDVDYKLTTATTWTNAVTGTTTLSVNLSALTANTNYDWRVRAKCSGGYGNYVTSQFTTVACSSPNTLTSTNISATAATLGWTAVSGASNYSVDYQNSSSATWTSVTASTTATSVNITGLSAYTTYNWRVKTNCTNGSFSAYATAQFTTPAPCTDLLEPNNTLTAPAPINTGAFINAQIATSTDLDYYSFSNNSTSKNIKITLTNLPANYNLILFDPNGKSVATSSNTGTANETIIYNTTVIGKYTVEVLGYNKAYSNTQCYSLNVQLGTSSFGPDLYSAGYLNSEIFKVYPVPAINNVSLIFKAYTSNPKIIVKDQLGKTVINKNIPSTPGNNLYNLDVSTLESGVYYIRFTNWKDLKTQKIIITK
ncbi:MAG: fibronectin type III domain-containing protein [Bacteroidota bacterium]|nr:fibronectin type III domain-containing protein [Bacteroidota bacterium]